MTPPTPTGSGLTVGEDYPKDLLEFEHRFRTEADCLTYVIKLRWPAGFLCPGCGSKESWQLGCGRYKCRSCRRETRVLAGTLFQDSRKSLVVWFRALWHVTNQKNGANALSLQRALGLGSYTTAWIWLHKMRRAMVRPGRDRLSGRVEVDEAFVGGEIIGLRGRSSGGKTLVAIAAQEKGPGLGRIRMHCIPDASKATLHSFAATELLPRVHLVASLLKRWLLGTHQGAVSPEHLDYYLDEFTFRFNRRTSKSRGLLFYRLLQQAVSLGPIVGTDIFSGKRRKNHNR